MTPQCKVPGCTKEAGTRGLCTMHYSRNRREALGVARPERYQVVDPLAKILSNIDVGFCWEWNRKLNNRGYGVTNVNKKRWYVHRLMWTLMVGPIPDGMEIDHMCRNRACCNPEHLDLVTGQVNTLRGVSPASSHAKRDECSYGHEYTAETMHVVRGARRCRICERRRDKERYERKKARAASDTKRREKAAKKEKRDA